MQKKKKKLFDVILCKYEIKKQEPKLVNHFFCFYFQMIFAKQNSAHK